MKRILLLLLSALLVFSMVACDEPAPSVPNVDDDETSSEESSSTSDPENPSSGEENPEKPAEEWLKVATYNILHCMDYPAYSSSPSRGIIAPEHIVDFAEEYEIEILGLNEVDVNCDRSIGFALSDYYKGGSNQPKYIAEELTARTGEQYYWAFGPALEGALTAAHKDAGQSMYGNAVISKYPIVSQRNVQVWDEEYHIIDPNDPKTQIYDHPNIGHFEIKASLVVELDVNGTIVTVISTHFGLTPGEQTRMATAIKGVLKDVKTPVILMGDMNLSYDSTIIQEFNLLLKPTSTASQPGTFVSGSRIDYIFTSEDIATKNLFVAHSVKYSDHFPVIVDMMLLDKKAS